MMIGGTRRQSTRSLPTTQTPMSESALLLRMGVAQLSIPINSCLSSGLFQPDVFFFYS